MRPGPDELLHFSEDPTITVFEPRVAPTAQVPGAYVWLATEAVSPLGPAEPAGDLLELHREAGIQLRLVDSLWPWWDAVTASSVGFSGIRLRNGIGCPLRMRLHRWHIEEREYARQESRRLHEFEVHPGDLLVEKTASSAFFPDRCPLPGMLRERGIATVLITGTVTNVCCESSARDASTPGFRVIMVADGNAAMRDQDHDATLHTIYRTFGWVLIDWDAAAPGSRLWDLSYAAQSMAGLRADRPVPESTARLRSFVDGYGLAERDRIELAPMLGRRARAMYDLLREGARLGRQPWARIWTEDGPYWLATAEYLETNTDAWTAALL